MTNFIATTIISALIGGSGAAGILFVVIKHYIDRSLEKREKREDERAYLRKEKRISEMDLWHANGRLLFWITKSMEEKGIQSEELEESMEKYNAAEERKKRLDNEIIVMMDQRD